MTRSKGLYLTAAPVAFLLLLSGGARLLSAHADQTPKAARSAPSESVPALPADIKAADAKTQRLLEKAVTGQLTALRKKDYAGALKFSASGFRDATPPENFGQMIKTRYAPLEDSVSATFLTARLQGDAAVVATTVAEKNGKKTRYAYLLVKEAKGWAIGSCQEINPPTRTTVTDEQEI